MKAKNIFKALATAMLIPAMLLSTACNKDKDINLNNKNTFIDGKYSVSSTKQVYFSKGNLQLNGENTWKFADNQWDYFGDSQSDNHRDLFGWGTGNNPNLTNTKNKDYSTFADWGNNTDLQSQLGTGWRTLTNDEWAYLINTRTVNGGTGSGYSYTLGQSVNSTLGIILYPDDYTGSAYAGSDWLSFESAGCVFLPAAGFRMGTILNNVNEWGFYWSSSNSDDSMAYNLTFDNSGNADTADPFNRFGGFSVRLVKNAN